MSIPLDAYTLVTHRDAFAFAHYGVDEPAGASVQEGPSLWHALAVLAGGTVAATAVEAHFISGALTSAASAVGVSEFFLGVILLALVGNAAECVSAVNFARQDRMGLAISIAVGSTIQIALLVAPPLVLVSAFGGKPMNLVFSSLITPSHAGRAMRWSAETRSLQGPPRHE